MKENERKYLVIPLIAYRVEGGFVALERRPLFSCPLGFFRGVYQLKLKC